MIWRLGRWSFFLLAGLFLFPGESRSQPEELLSRARSRGSVRVIVMLRAPFGPEGRLPSASAAETQRRAISRVQSRILARMASRGVTAPKRFTSIPFLAMEVDAAALATLYSDPEVAAVQEDFPVPLLEGAQPAQPPQEDLVSPSNLATSTALIRAVQAWNLGYTGEGRVVAILDTGVQNDHPFLAGKVVSEACFSTNDAAVSSISLCPGGAESSTAPGSALNCDASVPGCDHGTHVAGIAAGTGPSFSGVAKDADLIAIQVFSRFNDPRMCAAPCVLSWTSDQILGLERVLQLSSQFDIASVNMSLGGGRYSSASQCDAANVALKAAIDNLRSVGIATVIASGNNGWVDSMSSPGCISTAVSVGSTNLEGAISPFSNQAPFLSFYAPGQGIRSSVPFDAFAVKGGTSMATPHVAGAWAVLKERAPAASVDQILSSLRSTGSPITSTSGTWTTPLLRLDLAVNSLPGPQALNVTKTGAGSGMVGGNPSGINCGADCSETYAYGTSVTLTSTPGGGSTFAGWSGACAGTGTCVVSMTAARSVTATFNATPRALNVTKAGTGTGTVTSNPSGINCGADCSEIYAYGTSVTLTATPGGGSTFAGWSGACTGTGACVVSMTAARSVTATFTAPPEGFFTVTPCRLIDTRNPNGPLGGPALGAGSDRTFTVAGVCGIPSSAVSVSVNVAVTSSTAAGSLRLHPGGTSVPLIASANYSAGMTRSNNAIVLLNAAGQLAAYVDQTSGTVHFILDVNGYFK